MRNEQKPPGSDPYRSLDQNLATGDAINRFVLSRPRQKIVQLMKGQRILDVCCGTGNLTAMLAAAGCWPVGVDSSATMLSYARQKGTTAEFRQLDATQMPFDREFDAAVISLAIHEMPPQARVMAWECMRRAVTPGGRLVVLDFAVPRGNSLLARIAGSLIEQDERGTLSYDPEHYKNFQEFMRGGGLLTWMRNQNISLEEEYRFLGGTVALVTTRR